MIKKKHAFIKFLHPSLQYIAKTVSAFRVSAPTLFYPQVHMELWTF